MLRLAAVLPDWVLHPNGTQVCHAAYHGNAAAIRDCISYNAFSGWVGDLSLITLLATALTLIAGVYHHLNCHTDGCKRIGKHRLAGGKFLVCGRCLRADGFTPGRITVQHIHAEHARHHGHPVRDTGETIGETTDGDRW